MKHTKGPWEVMTTPSGYKTIRSSYVPKDADVKLRLASVDYDVDEDEATQNAHLIAAAPDLYEIVFLMSNGAIAYEDPRVMKALRKARGE